MRTEKVARWLKEARRYAKHIWCYEDLVDDHIERSIEAAIEERNVYEYVEWLGEKYDLERTDIGWGINAGTRFEKLNRI